MIGVDAPFHCFYITKFMPLGVNINLVIQLVMFFSMLQIQVKTQHGEAFVAQARKRPRRHHIFREFTGSDRTRLQHGFQESCKD
jgi:hypothetical protein